MFCKHNWEILSEQTTESYMEHMFKTVRTTKMPQYDTQIRSLCGRKLIQLVSCDKCSKIKKFVEVI